MAGGSPLEGGGGALTGECSGDSRSRSGRSKPSSRNNSDGGFRFLGVSGVGCVGVFLAGGCVVPGSMGSCALDFFGIFHVVASFPGAGAGVLVLGVSVVVLGVFFLGCGSKGALSVFRTRGFRGFG